MSDTYEGWSNRETWCANLWLANDQGLYAMVDEWAHELAAEASMDDEDRTTEPTYYLAEQIEGWFEEMSHGDGEDDYVPAASIYKVLADIGSLYRVDWREIAEHWLADVLAES